LLPPVHKGAPLPFTLLALPCPAPPSWQQTTRRPFTVTPLPRPPHIQTDMYNYSTNFYRHKAVDVIQRHDPKVPLFLYLPFQAVHDPFNDFREGADGSSPR